MSDQPLKIWLDEKGKLLRLRLAQPNANILDGRMMAALDKALADHADDDGLLAVLLDHEGSNFSFGASVPEHMPDQCAEMIAGMNALIRRMISCPVPILIAVNGQCLGGGLEVASAGSLLFAAPDAALGQPEIKVGVFAPAASVLLPIRVGQAAAEDLLFSGRSVDGEEAYEMGLVDFLDDDPEQAAFDYFNEHLAGLSAVVVRYAVQAARHGIIDRVDSQLTHMESLYVSGLMATHDAVEGLEAFIEKRPAKWEHR